MKKGFTLAEVLITLVILGVIAAMTIPTIMNNTRDMEYRAKAKKTYSMLSNAMAMTAVTLGYTPNMNVKFDSTSDINNWFNMYIKPNLNVIKVCNDTTGCWNQGDTYYLKGGKVKYNRPGIGIGNTILTAVLSDGTFLIIDSYYYESTETYFGIKIPSGQSSMVVFFDVNGDKKPNTVGRDIYVAVYADGALIPPYRDFPEKVDKDCSSSGTGYSCLAKIVDKALQH